MTVSGKRKLSDAEIWRMPPGLRRMRAREGERPRIAPKWPCLQEEGQSPEGLRAALEAHCLSLEGVERAQAPFDTPGIGFALAADLARGQPEAFISEPVWAVLRPDGALHLGLKPEWAQKVIDKGWATIHPFARYMAGAVPPQSLLVYAPRNEAELATVKRIAIAAHGYAVGRIGAVILPDTRW